jgi:hypothetical protein
MEEKIELPPEEIPAGPTAAPAAPPAELPPAAQVVNDGKTEREISLERDLEAERKARRQAETECAYAQDENKALKEIQSRTPAPAPRKPRRPGFTTLLHEEESE